jgi:hypothetical protein
MSCSAERPPQRTATRRRFGRFERRGVVALLTRGSLALATFAALDGAGMARVDLFLGADGRLRVNEINTIPGFTRISMFPEVDGSERDSVGGVDESIDRRSADESSEEEAEAKRGVTGQRLSERGT